MIPSDVLSRVRDQLVETTAAFWTDAELYRYMTDAEREINNQIHCYQLSTAATSVTAQSGYTLPSDCLYIHRVTYDGVPLREIDQRRGDTLDMPGYGGSVQSGSPTHYYRYGTDMIYMWPTPVTTAPVGYFYTGEPAAITTASTLFSIPANFHQPLQDYVLYRAFTKDQDQARSEWHKREYMQGIQDSEWRENKRRWKGGFLTVMDADKAYQTMDGMV